MNKIFYVYSTDGETSTFVADSTSGKAKSFACKNLSNCECITQLRIRQAVNKITGRVMVTKQQGFISNDLVFKYINSEVDII